MKKIKNGATIERLQGQLVYKPSSDHFKISSDPRYTIDSGPEFTPDRIKAALARSLAVEQSLSPDDEKPSD